MNRIIPVLIFVSLHLAATHCVSAEGRNMLSIGDLLSEASKHKRFQPVGRDELKRAESLFVDTLTHDRPSAELAESWAELGWRFEQMKADRGSKDTESAIWILREAPDAIRGRGFFAFRDGAQPIFLQAPHSFYDKHTRRITLDLFQRGSVSAAGWNTVRRSVHDAAHARDNYINAFTRAILQVNSRHAIVQLHGYDPAKRATKSGRNSEVIVSNGTRFPGRMVRSFSREFAKTTTGKVSMYPSQVEELGGTKNIQAGIVHQHGFDTFVHVEMAGDIRHKLRKDQGLRDRFHAVLISSLTAFLDEPT